MKIISFVFLMLNAACSLCIDVLDLLIFSINELSSLANDGDVVCNLHNVVLSMLAAIMTVDSEQEGAEHTTLVCAQVFTSPPNFKD